MLETDLPGEGEDLTKSIEGNPAQYPTDQAELDGIARWVRDTSNANGTGDDGWDWNPETMLLTINNEDGSVSEFSGLDIADTSRSDPRLDRLRSRVGI